LIIFYDFFCWTNPPIPTSREEQSRLAGQALPCQGGIYFINTKFSPDKGSCSAKLVGFVSTQSVK